MPRKKTETPAQANETPAAENTALSAMGDALTTITQNAVALADQLGYDGSLTVGALEDEIRFYQRRSVEAVMELGKRLLLLKELTPQGEFVQRVELLGINKRMAQRFMSATLKFAKSDTKSLLVSAGNQTKLLELVVLDDEEIAELADGGSARGIDLDDIATMTVTDLRNALREAREDAQAKDRILAQKNAMIDKLATEQTKGRGKRNAPSWPAEIDGLKDDLHALGKVMDEALSKHLTLIEATELVYQDMADDDPANEQYKGVVLRMGEQIERICTLAAGLRNKYDLTLSGYVELDKTHRLD